MLNFILCDDNPYILSSISKFLDIIFIKNNIDAQLVFSSSNWEDILSFTKNNSVDVAILDIELKSTKTGVDIANELRKDNKDLYIIFLTRTYGLHISSIKNKNIRLFVKANSY